MIGRPIRINETRRPLEIGGLCAIGIWMIWTSIFPETSTPGEPQKALVSLGLLVLSIGLSLLAGELLKRKNKALAQDDKPTALATRGSFIPRLIGRRRIGYVFTAAGNRQKAKEKAPGGKGSIFSGPKVDVYREDGWHALVVGEVYSLLRIEQQGVPIFEGPITNESHPSGSTINLGNEGSFRIFWGQNGVADGQPINNDPSFTAINGGISSSWPYLCYIQWVQKRLGPQPNWPLITYVVETRTRTAHLSMSNAFFEPTQVLSADTYPIGGVVTGIKGTAYWELAGDLSSRFQAQQHIKVTGNTGLGTDTEYTILKVTVTAFGLTTRLFTNEGISVSATADGDVVPYDADNDDGINPAHAIAELLFDDWPYGISQPKTGTNQEVDLDSLEDLGVLMETEGIRGSFIAPDGQDLQGLLGAILQDLGCFWSLNFRTGLLEFVPLRDPTGLTLPNITYDLQTRPPEIRGSQAERPVDRLVFQFTDQDNQYRDMTITVDDDGQATFAEFFRQRQVQIISTVHFNTASLIANRRELEEMAGGGDFRIYCNRGCRRLLPGSAVLVDGFSEVMRVTRVKSDPESGEVEVYVMPDFYGIPLSEFLVNPGSTGSGGTPVEQDLAFGLIEIPEILTGANGPQTVVVPRIRAHAAIIGADIYLSQDDTTYTFEGNDGSVMTGGTLSAALSSDDEMELDVGPEFTALGPDISSVLDLSSDISAWRKGRQLVVAINAGGEQEIMFLQRIENVAGSVYRMRGLIRARYDTRMIDLAMGAVVYILEDSDGLPIQDNVLLEPDTLVYSKSAPTGVGSVPLSSISPFSLTLYGKGVRPVPVSDIRLDLGSSSAGGGTARWSDVSYRLTAVPGEDDLDLIWAYSNPQSPGAGAGQQGAGVAVVDPPPEGDFIVEVLDLADTLKRTETVSVAAFTYTETDRLADFSASEPAGFKIRVTQLRGGYQAEPITQTFTNVT